MLHKKYLLGVFWSFFLICSAVEGQTVKDIDGNTYETVEIGNQVWFSMNLKTTKYRNGDMIGTTSFSGLDIGTFFQPKFQWAYEGKEKNVDTYGRLYTWYAVNDNRGVCPIGWSVPSDADWKALIDYLGGEVIAYTKLKEVGNYHWVKYDSGNNDFFFTALPGGSRNSNGQFDDIGIRCNWWSSTEYGEYVSWYRQMNYDFNNVNRYLNLKRNGLSVRCIKTF
jgi:uncharacterized protein (TIGR02145 family)